MTENNGLEILIINIGVIGEPHFTLDITRQDLVKVCGSDIGHHVFRFVLVRGYAGHSNYPCHDMGLKCILWLKMNPDFDILYSLQAKGWIAR